MENTSAPSARYGGITERKDPPAPVPDYRYPVTLYSDDYLPQTGDVTNISARLDGPGLWFGNEEKAMANACRNGDFTKFSNSFLGMWEKGKV